MIHLSAVWLTLSLAIWRFIMIKFPAMALTLCTTTRCNIVLILAFSQYLLFQYFPARTKFIVFSCSSVPHNPKLFAVRGEAGQSDHKLLPYRGKSQT